MATSKAHLCLLLCCAILSTLARAMSLPPSSVEESLTVTKKSGSGPGEPAMMFSFRTFPGPFSPFGLVRTGVMDNLFSPFWNFFNFNEKEVKPEKEQSASTTVSIGATKDGSGGSKVEDQVNIEYSGAVQTVGGPGSFRLGQDIADIDGYNFIRELQRYEQLAPPSKLSSGEVVSNTENSRSHHLSDDKDVTGHDQLTSTQAPGKDLTLTVVTDSFYFPGEPDTIGSGIDGDTLRYQGEGRELKKVETEVLQADTPKTKVKSATAFVLAQEDSGGITTTVTAAGKDTTLTTAENDKHEIQSLHQQLTQKSSFEQTIQSLRDWMKSETSSNKKNVPHSQDAKFLNSPLSSNTNEVSDILSTDGESIQSKDVGKTASAVIDNRQLIKDNYVTEDMTTLSGNVADFGGNNMSVKEELKKPGENVHDTLLLTRSPELPVHDVNLHPQEEKIVVVDEDTAGSDKKATNGVKRTTHQADMAPSAASTDKSTPPGISLSEKQKVTMSWRIKPGGERRPTLTEESSSPQPEHPRRHGVKRGEPLVWYLDSPVDKTQRRSVRGTRRSQVDGSETTTPSAVSSTNGTSSSDVLNDLALFQADYKKFLEMEALKEDIEAAENENDNVSGGDGLGVEESPAEEAGRSGGYLSKLTSDDRSVKAKSQGVVNSEQGDSVQGHQGSLDYEIRDDNNDEDNGDYDVSVESLEFRRRRSLKGKKRKLRRGQKTHRRPARIKPTTKAPKDSEKNQLQRRIHRDRRQNEHDDGVRKKRSLATRSIGPGRGASNHSLLDDADVVFIVKHQRPSTKVETKAGKSYNSPNTGKNKSVSSSGPSKEMREHISFFKSFNRLASEKRSDGNGKSQPGKFSRHVPGVGPRPMGSEDGGLGKTTTQSGVDGPSVHRLTPPNPLPERPVHPLHPHMHGPSRGPNLVWKHTQESNRHGAAILVFLCLALILVAVLVITLTKVTNDSNEPRRNDSSTALYVNYPHY